MKFANGNTVTYVLAGNKSFGTVTCGAMRKGRIWGRPCTFEIMPLGKSALFLSLQPRIYVLISFLFVTEEPVLKSCDVVEVSTSWMTVNCSLKQDTSQINLEFRQVSQYCNRDESTPCQIESSTQVCTLPGIFHIR